MSQHNEVEPPPVGQIRHTVTTSPALPVNTQTEDTIDIGRTLQLLLNRMDTREKQWLKTELVKDRVAQ